MAQSPPLPKMVAEVTKLWRPFCITRDGLVRVPEAQTGHGYTQELFKQDFESIEEFEAFLKSQPPGYYNDDYVGEFVLLPVFIRRTAVLSKELRGPVKAT